MYAAPGALSSVLGKQHASTYVCINFTHNRIGMCARVCDCERAPCAIRVGRTGSLRSFLIACNGNLHKEAL